MAVLVVQIYLLSLLDIFWFVLAMVLVLAAVMVSGFGNLFSKIFASVLFVLVSASAFSPVRP